MGSTYVSTFLTLKVSMLDPGAGEKRDQAARISASSAAVRERD